MVQSLRLYIIEGGYDMTNHKQSLMVSLLIRCKDLCDFKGLNPQPSKLSLHELTTMNTEKFLTETTIQKA